MKLYPVADRVPGLPLAHPFQYRAVLTGEKRVPRAGEWYLSGAIPAAYRMPTDGSSIVFAICRIVVAESVTTWRIVDEASQAQVPHR